MALDITTARADVAKIYIAAFDRVPDSAGLDFWVKSYMAGTDTLSSIAQKFTASTEYATSYPSYLTNTEYVARIYTNVFNRAADTDGQTFWVNHLVAGTLTRGTLMKAMVDAAAANSSTDGAMLANQATFGVWAAVNQVPFATANAQLSSITSVESTLTAAQTAVSGSVGGTTGQTFSVTAGIDAVNGTSGNDTINAVETAAAGRVLGALDVIDGGAGTDTLNVQNTQAAATFTFAGATIKNVETINVTTNGDFTGLDISGIAGLTTFVGAAADAVATTLTAANTTDVTLTLGTTNNSTVSGGKAVSVTKTDTAAGTLGITGKALTTVTVKDGAGIVTIDNVENSVAATTAKGTTMTAVVLDSVNADAAIKGEGLTSVTLKGVTSAPRTTTITNAVANHSLTVNVDGTGYNAAGTAQQSILVDAAAKTITVNATGAKSSLALTGSTSATTVNITGTAALNLAALASATTVDGSAASGALTLNTLNAATTTVKTGSGNDSFTLSATAKATVDSGAGNDIVTLGAALAAGSTVNLGAGNDSLLGTTVIAASAGANVTVVDAGDGTDTVASTLINAGNAAQFKNFEMISIGNATVDAALLTASTITGVSIDGSTGTGILQNVTQAQSLTVNADNGGTSATLSFTGVTGTTDAYAITFNATTTGTVASPTSIDAKTVSIEGIEAVTIHSNAAAGVVTNAIALKDAAAKTLTIDGSQALNVTFDTAFGTAGATTGVSSIDGSAATGKLGINLANVVNAAAGITVKGGSAVDTLTTSTSSATLTGNGGNDLFVTDATIAGNVDAALAKFVTITDFTKGDVLSLNNANAGTAAFTATKVDVSAAISLDSAVDLAMTGDGSTNAIVKWFNYGGNTYVTVDGSASGTLAATFDQIVKLTGTLDLSTSTLSATADLTFA